MIWIWQRYRRLCLARKTKALSALRFASLVQQIEQLAADRAKDWSRG